MRTCTFRCNLTGIDVMVSTKCSSGWCGCEYGRIKNNKNTHCLYTYIFTKGLPANFCIGKMHQIQSFTLFNWTKRTVKVHLELIERCQKGIYDVAQLPVIRMESNLWEELFCSPFEPREELAFHRSLLTIFSGNHKFGSQE